MKTSTKTIQNKSKQTPIKTIMSSTATVMGSTATATNFKRWVSSVNWKQEDHQVKGYEWCVQRENLTPAQRQQQTPYGGIIADEMGLGKTTLILALMQLNNDIPILNAGMPTTTSKKTLIVLPAMLIQQWNSIIKSKLNIDPYIFHGNDAKYRVRVSKNELGNKESKREKMNLKILKEIINTQSVVITTYGMISDRTTKPSNSRKPYKPYHCVLWDYHWDRIVFDEAHNMRNRNTGVFRGAMQLGNKTTARWLVTGTPIQNKVSDLGSLSIILNTPEIVHGNSSEKRIRAFETKYILRRHKTDIDTVLPKLNVNCVSVEWSNENEKRVSDVLHSNLSFAPVTEANVDEIMRYLGNREYFAMLTRCRQVCILPSLARPGFSPHPGILQIPNEEVVENLIYDFKQSPIFHAESSKMNALMTKITENKDNNHDKLIFCHYRGEMDTLSRRIRTETNLRVSTIRGGMTAKARAAALSQNVNSNTLYDALSPLFKKLTSNFPERLCDHILSYIKNDVLIMQIKSGSDGLNLQQYSEVYFTSPHWNPSVEDQALARVHRIGQKKDVTVYKFIMNRVNGGGSPSFDAYCNAVQNMKRKVQKEYNLLASSTTQIKDPYYNV
jgi:transcription termination factor 2